MRHPHNRFHGLHALALLGAASLLGSGCGHPSTPGMTNGGTGGTTVGGLGGNGGGMTTGAGGDDMVIDTDGGVTGAGGAAPPTACADDPNQQQALPYTKGYTISASATSQASSAVQSMSDAQKQNQLRGTSIGQYNDIFRSAHNLSDPSYADTGSVKEFQFSDGPRGVNLDAVKTSGSQGYSTVFPVASMRGATFDVDLENQVGAAMGDELIAAGRTMLLAPTVNILRHPAWGRAEETYGEDSFLLGRMGSAYVIGVQTYAPACAKHFAANNIERNRDNGDIAQMDEQTLREVYARHFGMIIRDGGVSCVMAAYNEMQVGSGQALNCTQNQHLLTDILRTDFKFQGMVISDWWAMPGGQMPAGGTATESSQARQALMAGLDLEMPWNLNFSQLPTVDSTQNAAALRVVTEKFRFNVAATTGQIGLVPPTTVFNTGTFSITNNDAHIALAQKAALEGMVLLKNDGGVLPIKSGGNIQSVAVVGLSVPWTLKGVQATGSVNFPVDARIGDLGSSRVNLDPAKTVGPYAGIMSAAPAGIMVMSGHDLAAAQAADFVVVVAGLTPHDEGEDYTIKPDDSDRDASLALDGKTGTNAQNTFIQQVAMLNKPMVVVLEGGSVIDASAWAGMVPAIVMAWYPGQAGGAALGQLLFGQANFSGKLPITWAAIDQEPRFSGTDSAPASLTTTMGYYLGYRWFDTQGKTPQYAFGTGLSYSGEFAYSNLNVPCSTVTKNGVVNVTVDIKNNSAVDGDEIAFLFVSWPSSKVTTRQAPNYKELKGFKRVSLPHGVAKRVTIPIRVSDLNYWDTASSSWQIETGPVKVMVGTSSDKLTTPPGMFTVQ